jgi:hypothetical protein
MKTPGPARIVAVLLLLGPACTGSDDVVTRRQERTPSSAPPPISSPATSPTDDCPNAEAVALDESLRLSGTLQGDVDGDGGEDSVYLAEDPGAAPECKLFVLVSTTQTTHQASIRHSEIFESGISQPRLNTVAQIDGRAGLEVVIDLISGASTVFAGVFTMGGGELVQVKSDTPGMAVGDLFAYGGSVGHLDGVDCSSTGVVASTAVARDDSYRVKRYFLVPREDELIVDRGLTEKAVIALEDLDRFPEFVRSPFGSCPTD